MSQQEFAEVLAIGLGRMVSQVNISNWLRGVVPRSKKGEPDVSALVLKTAERIADSEFNSGRNKYAKSAQVQAQFTKWDQAGLTPKQVRIAAEISVSLYNAWRNQKVKILEVRWEVARAKVDLWEAFIVEHQKGWQDRTAPPAPTDKPTSSQKGRRPRGR